MVTKEEWKRYKERSESWFFGFVFGMFVGAITALAFFKNEEIKEQKQEQKIIELIEKHKEQ